MDYKEILSSLTVIVDTREQSWAHIEDVFKRKNIKYRRQKLDAGDYSFEITVNGEQISFTDTIVIERKNSLDELASCLTADRERFKREFERMENADTDCILLVENAKLSDLREGNYRSKISAAAFEASLWAWKWRFGYDVFFIEKQCSGEYIYNLFYYYARELYKEHANGKS